MLSKRIPVRELIELKGNRKAETGDRKEKAESIKARKIESKSCHPNLNYLD